MSNEGFNLRDIRISIDSHGSGTIHMGDVDISNAVNGFQIDSRVGEVPKLELGWTPPTQGVWTPSSS